MAAAVVAHDAKAARECRDLRLPHLQRRAERIGQQQRRCAAVAVEAVMQADVAKLRERHDERLLQRRTRDDGRARARCTRRFRQGTRPDRTVARSHPRRARRAPPGRQRECRANATRRATARRQALATSACAASRPIAGASAICAASAKISPCVRSRFAAHPVGVDVEPLGHVRHRVERAGGRACTICRQRFPFGRPVAEAALVLLHGRGEHRRDEARYAHGRRQRNRRADRIALLRHRRRAAASRAPPARTLRRPRSAQAARCRARACRASPSACRA